MNNVSLAGNGGEETDNDVTILDKRAPTRSTRAMGMGAMASTTVALKGIGKCLTVETNKVNPNV